MTLDEIRTLVARLGHPVLTGEPESAAEHTDPAPIHAGVTA